MSFLRLLIIVALFYLIFKVLRGWTTPGPGRTGVEAGRRPAPPGKARTEDLVKDPLCGVYFPRSEGLAYMVDGRVLYFCSVECRDKFLQARNVKN